MLSGALCALLFAATAPAATRDKDGVDRQRELEQARKELHDARDELARAAKELARATAQLEPDSPRAQAFEFVANPRRAMLGVGVATGPEKDGELHGVLITAVTPGSGADKAGIKTGDVLLSANGKSLVTKKGERPRPERKLVDLMRELSPGDKVEIDFEREGKTSHASVIAQRPEPMTFGSMMDMDDDDNIDLLLPKGPMAWPSLLEGDARLQLAKLDADLGSYFQARDGVLVVKSPKDKDDTLALKSGDVIVKIDGDAVDSPVEAMERLREAGDRDVKLDVIRHGKHETLKGKSPVKRRTVHQRIEIHGDQEP
jgi:C-terminal processing protease CtpA/Prc